MDYLIFRELNQFAGKWSLLDKLGVFFAEYFGYILIFILFLFLLKNLKKHWFIALQAILAAVLARFGITELIRFFWERQRPFAENNVNLLFNHPATGSFPSGHAAFFFGLSAVVYFYNKRVGVLFFIASFLISISRVFAGVHWPSDILAGAFVGILSAFIIIFLSRKFFPIEKKK